MDESKALAGSGKDWKGMDGMEGKGEEEQEKGEEEKGEEGAQSTYSQNLGSKSSVRPIRSRASHSGRRSA